MSSFSRRRGAPRFNLAWFRRRRHFQEAAGFCARCQTPLFHDYRRTQSDLYCGDECKHLGPHLPEQK